MTVTLSCFFADLNNEKTFRELSKPIGALNETRLAQLKVTMFYFYVLVYLLKVSAETTFNMIKKSGQKLKNKLPA